MMNRVLYKNGHYILECDPSKMFCILSHFMMDLILQEINLRMLGQKYCEPIFSDAEPNS